jgi:hypothetical protein
MRDDGPPGADPPWRAGTTGMLTLADGDELSPDGDEVCGSDGCRL